MSQTEETSSTALKDKATSEAILLSDDDGSQSSEQTVKLPVKPEPNKIDENDSSDDDNDEDMDKTEGIGSQLKRTRMLKEDDKANDMKEKFFLKISNFPSGWDLGKVHEFLKKECGEVSIAYMDMAKNQNMCCVLEFSSIKKCRTARETLDGKVLGDSKLTAEIRDSYTGDSDDETAPPKKKTKSKKDWRPELDVWEIDPRGLYGFKREYLDSLGITPPIDRWVFVTMFRCDKSELKEVMELAGNVLLCSVDTKAGVKCAHVMYSHPLEAVQAVSMLNKQVFYGTPLKVEVELCPVGTTFLPKGLTSTGPGLGCNGKPLRDIVKQYERFVCNKSSFVNPSLFKSPNILFGTVDNGQSNSLVTNFGSTSSNGSFHGQVSAPVVTANFPSVSPLLGSAPIVPIRPNPGPVMGPNPRSSLLPTPVRGIQPRPISALLGPRPGFPGPQSVGPINAPVQVAGPMAGPVRPVAPTVMPTASNTVEISNLPLSTTFPFLCEKMAQCGQVMTLQLTSPGCAVVQFAQRLHADRCFQQYNGYCVQGHIIQVKYL